MITVSVINDGVIKRPSRELTREERATVIFQECDGTDYKFYQNGDQLPPKTQVTPAPNWNGLTQDLNGSSLLTHAYQYARGNGFSYLLKVLTDGEIGSASENSFVIAVNLCFPQGWQYQLSTSQLSELNGYLSSNHFTVQIQPQQAARRRAVDNDENPATEEWKPFTIAPEVKLSWLQRVLKKIRDFCDSFIP